MLVIADAVKPMAVAGVMGGEHSGINDDTTEVLLESATFRPGAVRATSKKLGMLSDASYRFMRGVEAELADWASRRAAQLMADLAGATVLKGVVDVWPEPKTPWRVTCRSARLEALLGLSATPETIAQAFESLGLKVLAASADAIEVEVPTFREDLTREADLIEEYARLHLKELPPVRPMATIVPEADDSPAQAQARFVKSWRAWVCSRSCTTAFWAEGLLDLFDKDSAARRVRLPIR